MKAGTAALVLAPTLDLSRASPLVAEMRARQGRPITIDASAVRVLGGQCLQILLAGRSAWSVDGLPFHVVSASAAFTEQVALFGATPLAHASRPGSVAEEAGRPS